MLFALRRVLLALILCVGCLASGLSAQSRNRQEVENKTLTTKDGVELAVTYYTSNVGKDATPVVMLHDEKETRQTYSDLAERLAKPDSSKGDKHRSFAVVTVDLRGHGESVKQVYQGRTRELNASKLRAADYTAMALRDMEAVRKFLLAENDAGRLNLNRLSVFGVGLGAAVALNWTAADWAAPPLATGKQGQDVKTLVLVSPRWKQNLSVQTALRQAGLRTEVSVLMMYGEGDRRVKSDAERIYGQLENDREFDKKAKFPSIMKVGVDTELQGAMWLKKADEKGERLIIDYLTTHSVDPEFEWTSRKRF